MTRQIKGNSSMLEVARGSRELPKSAFETVILERDNDLPLKFNGRLIGCNHPDEEANTGTLVEIFVTKSGKLVTSVWQWQDAKNRERHAAAAHQTPDQALEWLKQDGGGYLGKASRAAWEEACENHLPLQGHDVEVID